MDLDPNRSAIKGRTAHSHIGDKTLQDIGQIEVGRHRCIEAAVHQVPSELGVIFHVLHEVLTIAGAVISEHVKERLLGSVFADQFEKGSRGQQDSLSVALVKNLIGIKIFHRV